ncbi:DUF4263 domain-containing protein [bacterium]|nr:DUF4263 domain-containing protein [bacterium]
MRTRLNLDTFEPYPKDWPPREYFVSQRDIEKNVLEHFRQVVSANAPETDIDALIREHPNILATCFRLTMTGHHGVWVIPQQVIRPPMRPVECGLKPDFILGGKGSDGFSWFVVELKGADDAIFVGSDGKTYFSGAANRGVFQLLQYVDYCSQNQAWLRDTLQLTDFREPRGFLFVGREKELEENETRGRLKGAWNRLAGGRLEIHTYDVLIRWFVDGALEQPAATV